MTTRQPQPDLRDGDSTRPPGRTRADRRGAWEAVCGVLTALVFIAGAVGSIVGIAIGAGWTPVAASELVLVASLLGLLMVLLLWPIAAAVRGQRQVLTIMSARQDAMSSAVRSLAEQSALSDDARRVLNRRMERDLLRRAIEEDIAAEDWDAAAVLCAELADQFGYRADAEELRRRIDRARFQTMERDVADAVAEMDAMLAQRNWAEAQVAAARIARMYPESPSVEGLRHRVARVRGAYRAELEIRFRAAAEEDRVEEALDLLEELDRYLTEADARPYVEVARTVIEKAKGQLGEQFKAAVHDRDWEAASRIGGRITSRFPNTRMAQEVRAVLETIQQRASAEHRERA